MIVSLVLTPFLLLLGVGSGGAGHGDYRLAMMLFPYTMLSTFVFDSITVPFIVLAIIQFPLYGVTLGYANQRGRFGWVAILLAIVRVKQSACSLYRVLPDKSAGADGYIRVIDESGRDYLYAEDFFWPIHLPKAAEKALLSAA